MPIFKGTRPRVLEDGYVRVDGVFDRWPATPRRRPRAGPVRFPPLLPHGGLFQSRRTHRHILPSAPSGGQSGLWRPPPSQRVCTCGVPRRERLPVPRRRPGWAGGAGAATLLQSPRLQRRAPADVKFTPTCRRVGPVPASRTRGLRLHLLSGFEIFPVLGANESWRLVVDDICLPGDRWCHTPFTGLWPFFFFLLVSYY